MQTILRNGIVNCRLAPRIIRLSFNPNDFLQKNIILFGKPSSIRHMYHETIGNQERFRRMQNKWLQHDKVPMNYELIYKSPMDLSMSLMQGATLMAAVFLFSILGYDMLYSLDDFSKPMKTDDGFVLANSRYDVMGFAAMSAVILIAMRMVTARLVLRIYNFDTKYVAVFRGYLPGLIRKTYYETGQVKHIAPTGIVGWKESRYSFNNKRAILMHKFFRAHYDLTKMISDPTSEQNEDTNN